MRTLILGTIVAIFLLSAQTYGQISEEQLDSPLVVELSEASLVSALSYLAYGHQIPIGVEISTTYRKDQFDCTVIEGNVLRIKNLIRVHGGTLREILNSVVSQYPDYKWEVVDGVINVYPIRNRDRLLNELLSAPIDDIGKRERLEPSELLDLILLSDSVSRILTTNQAAVFRADPLNLLIVANNTVVDSFLANNTTVRGALNKFVLRSGQKIWIVEETGEAKKQISFNF